MKEKTVIIQNWEESERGWGTRPDGWTIHIDREQSVRMISTRGSKRKHSRKLIDESPIVSGEKDGYSRLVPYELSKK